jgi:hypothetical protein
MDDAEGGPGGDSASEGGTENAFGGQSNASSGGQSNVGSGGHDASGGEVGGRAAESGGVLGSGGVTVGGAGAPGASTCDELQQEAERNLRERVAASRLCEFDDECTRISFPADTCVGMCGVVLSKGRAFSVLQSSSICYDFFAHGCVAFPIPCPAPGVARCESGICVER